MLSELYNFFFSWLWSGAVPSALADVAVPITAFLAIVIGFLIIYLTFKLVFGLLYHIISYFH